jgi:nucleoid-associated protein YgaU
MKDKLRKIVREIMKEKVISELDEAQSPAQKAAFEKMLAKKDGKEESTDDKESVKEEIDTKKANQIRKAASGYVGPKFAKKASDEDILAMADLKDEKASLYNRHLKDIMGKISKLQKKYNIKESIIKEGFSTWEVIFDNMNLSGVKLSKKNKYTIKARNTVEAIKKAAKMAGVKDGQWIATKTHSVIKKG